MSIFDTKDYNTCPFDLMLNYPKQYDNVRTSSRFDPFQTQTSDTLRKESLSMIDKLQNQPITTQNAGHMTSIHQSQNNTNRVYNFNNTPNNTTSNTLNNGLSKGISKGIPRPSPSNNASSQALNNHGPSFQSWSSGDTSQNSFQYMKPSPPITAQNTSHMTSLQPTTAQNTNHMTSLHQSLSTSPLNGYSNNSPESPDLSFLSSYSRLNSYINSSPPSSLPPTSLIPKIETMKVSDFLNQSLPTAPRTQDNPPPPPPHMFDIEHEDNEEEDLFTTFLTGSLNGFSPPINGLSPPIRRQNTEEDISQSDNVNVWDYLSNFSPDSTVKKNAWSKPLKFEENSKDGLLEPVLSYKEKDTIAPLKETSSTLNVSTMKAPTVGRKVSELDDFDTVPRKSEPIKSQGDFQVVSSKRNKTTKMVKTPPPGIEKCSYGERCLFGTECSRWHSPDDHEAFNRQKLPNGARKCPWGVKCFRKLKCINYHTDKDLDQFKREMK